ncbi:uncharacterized protein HD556DRAFT_22997 [Suillus plorans]|uniref:Uncharacterized protein n=1 Tax=Suillus plorans TaxID=116603 RepID=A0A9P7J9D3_9AGAM|nr:uncharacterized protein HD556DRAFT_22997 [Suillus plorans]KAG1810046.1 hypothetical protein HD556DRAFT_22997 [Suillus plorans]
MFRNAITSNARICTASYTRSIHATPAASTVTEKVSEMADKVNKKVGQGLASAIETGEKAAGKTKETLGSTTASAKQKTEDAKQTTQETTEQAKQKVNQVNYPWRANRLSCQLLISVQAAAGARETKDDVKGRMSK